MALLFGVIIGLALGLTGGGGSIFAVPLLVYGLRLPAHDAVSVSLAAVAMTAAFGTIGAIRARLVDYRAGLFFAIAGAVGAPIGVNASHNFSERTILVAFAVLMILVAITMWIRALRFPKAAAIVRADYVPAIATGGEAGPVCRISADEQLRLTAPCSVVLTGTGIGTGFLSGLFGVGGGFVIVPALTFVTRLSMHRAVATSLFVITLIGLSGLASILLEGRGLPWDITAMFVAGGFAGMILGRLIAKRMAGPRLQKVFAVAIVFVAVFVLASRQ